MIAPITTDDVRRLYRAWQGHKNGVSLDLVGEWLAYYISDQPVGIVSYRRVGAARRVKSLLVDPDHRRKGIGAALIAAASQECPCTAFATPASRALFARAGYVETSRSARGIAYMKKP